MICDFDPFFELPQEFPWRASVEASFTFLQEQLEVLFGDAVEFRHMTLGLVPEVLNTVDVVVVIGEQLRMVDADMMKVRDVERVIACPGVRIDGAVW